MTTAARPFASHVPALDGLRGVAILLVLAHNFDIIEGATSRSTRILGLALNLGWLGVQLFFVLSGFLITGILLETRKAPNYWSAFLVRRALRILPLYYAALLCAFVLAPLLGHATLGAERQLWSWLYLANFVEPIPILPQLWSLSVEEQFYFTWPLVIQVVPRRAVVALSCALVVFAVVSRVLLRESSFGPEAAYRFTFGRIDALALGALGAIFIRHAAARAWLVARRTLLRTAALGLLMVTLIATRGAPRLGFSSQAYGYTVFALVFAWLVVDLACAEPRDPLARAMCWAPLRSFGRYSYGMYIVHAPIQLLLGFPLLVRFAGVQPRQGTTSGALEIAYFLGATALTYAVAVVSYEAFERRFLALKRRFEPRAPSP